MKFAPRSTLLALGPFALLRSGPAARPVFRGHFDPGGGLARAALAAFPADEGLRRRAAEP